MTNEMQEDHRMILEKINEGKIKTLDVRPILAGGIDPFSKIMEEIKVLPEDTSLEIVNTFEPIPLINILRKKGYTSYTKSEGPVIHTYFLKSETPVAIGEVPANDHISVEAMAHVKNCFSGKLREVDVRDMEMPVPMVTILNELENLPGDFALFVHHKKVPQYLLPEISNRKWKVKIAIADAENVKLLIHR